MPFGLQPWHLLIALVAIIVIMGPKRLPEIGQAMGKTLRGFKDELDGPQPPASTVATAAAPAEPAASAAVAAPPGPATTSAASAVPPAPPIPVAPPDQV